MHRHLVPIVEGLRGRVRQSRVVSFDETGARVIEQSRSQWVFVGGRMTYRAVGSQRESPLFHPVSQPLRVSIRCGSGSTGSVIGILLGALI